MEGRGGACTSAKAAVVQGVFQQNGHLSLEAGRAMFQSYLFFSLFTNVVSWNMENALPAPRLRTKCILQRAAGTLMRSF